MAREANKSLKVNTIYFIITLCKVIYISLIWNSFSVFWIIVPQINSDAFPSPKIDANVVGGVLYKAVWNVLYQDLSIPPDLCLMQAPGMMKILEPAVLCSAVGQ